MLKILFAILGVFPIMTVTRLDYTVDRNWQDTQLFETMVEPLVNAPSDTPFRF